MIGYCMMIPQELWLIQTGVELVVHFMFYLVPDCSFTTAVPLTLQQDHPLAVISMIVFSCQ